MQKPLIAAESRRTSGRAGQASQHDRSSFTPVMGHFNLFGEYVFSNEKLQDCKYVGICIQDNTGVLLPRSAPGIVPENWEPPDR